MSLKSVMTSWTVTSVSAPHRSVIKQTEVTVAGTFILIVYGNIGSSKFFRLQSSLLTTLTTKLGMTLSEVSWSMRRYYAALR